MKLLFLLVLLGLGHILICRQNLLLSSEESSPCLCNIVMKFLMVVLLLTNIPMFVGIVSNKFIWGHDDIRENVAERKVSGGSSNSVINTNDSIALGYPSAMEYSMALGYHNIASAYTPPTTQIEERIR